MASFAHRRQVLLFLVAVVLPCTVLVALGLRIIGQDRELSERRLADERRLLARELRQTLLDRLERVRRDETTRIAAEPEHLLSTEFSDSAVVLVARLIDGKLVLPWEQNEVTERVQRLLGQQPFARSIAEGERAEFASERADAALTAYEQALQAARHPVQRYYVRLLLGRASSKLGHEREATRHYLTVLASPADVTDEFGITLWSYAAARLLDGDSGPHDVLARVDGEIGSARWLAPAQLYLYRALADTLAARAADSAAAARARQLSLSVAKRIDMVEKTVALKRDLTRLPISLDPSGSTQTSWAYWDGADWLVGAVLSTNETTSILLAAQASQLFGSLMVARASDAHATASLVTDPAADGELLGAEFPGLKLQFSAPPEDALGGSWNLRLWFYLLAVLLVVSVTVFGAYLQRRDVQRELRMAAMRSRFVSSVSHELKTPLTAIRILAETLRMRTAKPEKQSQYLDTIVSESERLTRLLNNVLDFTKIERGAKIYSREPQTLSEIVHASARAMQYPLEQKNFNLKVSISDGLPPVNVDRDAIEQAILNLLANAMKYSGDSRDIDLGLEMVGSEAVISVADRGVGIAAEEQGRVFDQFYRAKTEENQHVPGTGLGLTLVDHITRAHDGYVTVESLPGQGSTFAIHLPIERGDR